MDEKETKLASIIIPAYNMQSHIKRCVFSLINQTYKNLQIIIIDDGSTDNTYSICEQLLKEDARILLLHQNNAGVSAARNNGLIHSKGEYVLFCDADDYAEPDWVKLLIYAVEKKESKWGICGFKQSKKSSSINNIPKDNYSLLDLYEKNLLAYNWNKVYFNSVIKDNNLRFNCKFKNGEDLLFNLEYLLCIDTKPIYISKPLYNYLENFNSASYKYSEDMWNNKKYIFDVLKQCIIEKDNSIGLDRYHKHFMFMAERCMRNLRFKGNTYRKTERIQAFQRILNDPLTGEAIRNTDLNTLHMPYALLFQLRSGVLFELFFDLYDIKCKIVN